jgi:hypothetical protein
MLCLSPRCSIRVLFCGSPHRFIASTSLPILWPNALDQFNLHPQPLLNQTCRALLAMHKVRVRGKLEACFTANKENILGDTFCSDVIFIRSFYEKLFEIIRRTRRVILIGNPGISKSV